MISIFGPSFLAMGFHGVPEWFAPTRAPEMMVAFLIKMPHQSISLKNIVVSMPMIWAVIFGRMWNVRPNGESVRVDETGDMEFPMQRRQERGSDGDR